MKQNRIIALLLAAAMSLSLLCGAAWGAEPEDLGDLSAPAAVSAFAAEDAGSKDDVPEKDLELAQAEESEESEQAQEPEEAGEEEPEEPEEAGEEESEESEGPEESGEPEESKQVQGEPEEQDGSAEEAEETEEGCLSQVNPAYEDLVSPEELEKAQAEAQAQSEELSVQASGKVYTTVKAAGAALRGKMKQRKKTIIVTYQCKSANNDAVAKSVFLEAVRHTGKPTEGDYLNGQWWRWNCYYRRRRAKKHYTYQLTYYLSYFTTAAQEKKTDAAVKRILNKLDLKKDRSAVKIHKIYNYLCSNVAYDYAGSAQGSGNLLCHSAYAAAVKKKAVCQGYALLLYRLMLESGVPCRYITGSGGGASHAWNIIKMGKKYFNADSTWDAGQKEKGKYFDYYLRSDANFSGHVRYPEYRTRSFYKAYPMSAVDADYHFWEQDYTVDVAPSCTGEGSKSIHCADCGIHKNETHVPAAGHQWVYQGAWYSQSLGCDVEYYVCSVCGKYGYIERREELAYAAAQGTIRAQSITRSWSAKRQSFSLGARSQGGKLSYTSNQKAVKVSTSGRVTVSAGYAGRAVITICSQATQDVPAAKRRVSVTVRPRAARLCRLRPAGKGALCVRWRRESSAAGYEVQYATDRRFKRDVKSVKAEQTARVTLKGLKKGSRCYVRVRSLAGGARSEWSGRLSARVK